MADPQSSSDQVSPETSKRVCAHMNIDHAVSVYAMAKSVLSLDKGWKLSSATLKSVSLQGCEIQAITCRADMCEMKRLSYPFDPPLQSSSELRSRLVAIHHLVLSPRLSWLIRKPLALSILIVCGFLSYGTFFMSESELSRTVETFGLPQTFVSAVVASTYGAWSIHGLEAVYAGYHAWKTLELRPRAIAKWSFMITLVGYPVMTEFTTLLAIAQEQPTNKDK